MSDSPISLNVSHLRSGFFHRAAFAAQTFAGRCIVLLLLFVPVSPADASELEPWKVDFVNEGFEETFPGPGWSVQGDPTWGKTNYRASSGSNSVYCVRGGSLGVDPATPGVLYPNNAAASITYGPFDLSDATSAQLDYNIWHQLENDYDFVDVLRSSNGIDFTLSNSFTGSSSDWIIGSLDMDWLAGDASVWIRFRFRSDASVQYHGAYLDNIRIYKYVLPPNDLFSNAIPISGESGSTTGYNVFASKESGEPSLGSGGPQASVWWSWTAPRTGWVKFDTFGSDYNTALGVYTGSSVSALITQAENDNDQLTYQSRVVFFATQGVTYWIAVGGTYTDMGPPALGRIQLNWSSDGWLTRAIDERATTQTTWIPAGNSASSIMGPGVTYDWDPTNQALRVRTFSVEPYNGRIRHRIGGWYALQAPDVLPYSAVGGNTVVRGKFYVYATGQATSASNQIPPFQMRLSTGYQVTSNLEITPHLNDIPGDEPILDDLAPSKDPNAPSVYRVDHDPIETPYLLANANNIALAIRPAFTVQALDPQDNGYVALTECLVGTYPAYVNIDPLTTPILRAYEAEDMNPLVADGAIAYNVVPGTLEGANGRAEIPLLYGGSYTGTDVPAIQYNGTLVTHESSSVPSNKIGVTTQYFSATRKGSLPHSQTARVSPGKQYLVTFRISSLQQANRQSAFWLHARSAGFGYAQKLEFAGARVMPGYNDPDNAYGREVLPSTTDAVTSDYYQIRMHTPISSEIGLQTQLFDQPGPGVNLPSYRDINVALMLIDSFNIGTPGAEFEQGSIRCSLIHIFEIDAVVD
jgi:hypothetical protein